MHADNVAKPGWLAALINCADASDAKTAIVNASWDIWDGKDGVTPGEQGSAADLKTVVGGTLAVQQTLWQGCWWHISSSIVRLSAFRQVGGLPRGLRLKGDWDFMLRIQS
jgi:hypothetical protein